MSIRRSGSSFLTSRRSPGCNDVLSTWYYSPCTDYFARTSMKGTRGEQVGASILKLQSCETSETCNISLCTLTLVPGENGTRKRTKESGVYGRLRRPNFCIHFPLLFQLSTPYLSPVRPPQQLEAVGIRRRLRELRARNMSSAPL